MRVFCVALALITAMSATGVHAQDCANAASQTALNICADQAYNKTDGELNAVYQQVMLRLKENKDETRLLVAAQNHWIAFRNAECAFSTSRAAQGSIQPMLVAQCRNGLTGKRVAELRAYLHCQEGDMGCPVPSD